MCDKVYVCSLPTADVCSLPTADVCGLSIADARWRMKDLEKRAKWGKCSVTHYLAMLQYIDEQVMYEKFLSQSQMCGVALCPLPRYATVEKR